MIILLSIVTFCIYPIVMFCKLGKETNYICEGDGKKQMHYLLAVLLGCVTLGIYPLVWCAKCMNRLQDNAYRYGPTVNPPNSGSSFVLWTLLGAFIGIGPIVAWVKFAKDVNEFAGLAGEITPLVYTSNNVERAQMVQSFKAIPLNSVQPVQQIPQNANASLGVMPSKQEAVTTNPETSTPEPDEVPATTAAAGYRSINVVGSINCMGGMYQGMEFPIQDGEILVFGSDPAFSNIVIDDPQVSAKHCTVRFSAKENVYFVTDNSSAYGTYWGTGERLAPEIPYTANVGTVVNLGNTVNTFSLGR